MYMLIALRVSFWKTGRRKLLKILTPFLMLYISYLRVTEGLEAYKVTRIMNVQQV
jgi:hypothetical protein